MNMWKQTYLRSSVFFPITLRGGVCVLYPPNPPHVPHHILPCTLPQTQTRLYNLPQTLPHTTEPHTTSHTTPYHLSNPTTYRATQKTPTHSPPPGPSHTLPYSPPHTRLHSPPQTPPRAPLDISNHEPWLVLTFIKKKKSQAFSKNRISFTKCNSTCGLLNIYSSSIQSTFAKWLHKVKFTEKPRNSLF